MPRSRNKPPASLHGIGLAMKTTAPAPLTADRREALRLRIMASLAEQDTARLLPFPVPSVNNRVVVRVAAGVAAAVIATSQPLISSQLHDGSESSYVEEGALTANGESLLSFRTGEVLTAAAQSTLHFPATGIRAEVDAGTTFVLTRESGPFALNLQQGTITVRSRGKDFAVSTETWTARFNVGGVAVFSTSKGSASIIVIEGSGQLHTLAMVCSIEAGMHLSITPEGACSLVHPDAGIAELPPDLPGSVPSTQPPPSGAPSVSNLPAATFAPGLPPSAPPTGDHPAPAPAPSGSPASQSPTPGSASTQPGSAPSPSMPYDETPPELQDQGNEVPGEVPGEAPPSSPAESQGDPGAGGGSTQDDPAEDPPGDGSSSTSPSSPGNSASAPGHTGSAGSAANAPGQAGGSGTGQPVEPGKSGSAPGQTGTTPGQDGTAGSSADAPGQVTAASADPPTKGKSATAPGQALTTEAPGNSENAAGQSDTAASQNQPGSPGKSAGAPGQVMLASSTGQDAPDTHPGDTTPVVPPSLASDPPKKGSSAGAPGQATDNQVPGNAADPAGQAGAQGNSSDAPGEPGNTAGAPGQSGNQGKNKKL